MLMTVSLAASKMGARQGLAQTQIAAYDHVRRSAPPIDLVWLTWSWMHLHDIRISKNVNGWGALHLRNAFESQRPNWIRALPVMWAVRGYTFRFLAPARPGDVALPNSDMRGRDPFLNEMFELFTQRATTILHAAGHNVRLVAPTIRSYCLHGGPPNF